MKYLLPLTAALILPFASQANSRAGWSVVPYVGYSSLGDQQATASDFDTGDGAIDITVDDGFTAGLSVRYRYDSPLSAEFGWEYRSNDSVITDATGADLPGGNYASNIFYLNGRYNLPLNRGAWQPWVGGGLTWVQEIDLDSETLPAETSYSEGGAAGFQLMAGINRDINERWYLTSELRYSNLQSLTLDQEGGGNGTVSNIDYQPVTLQIGLGYRF